jgi:branched-subunit amino acid transport protein
VAEIGLLIFLMALVTFVPRFIPIIFLSRRNLPIPVTRWLSYVPVAVLAALLSPSLLVPDGRLNVAYNTNPAFWVAIPVFAIAYFTRNLFATVLTGMALMALLRLFA